MAGRFGVRRLDANRLELPNDYGIPVRIFANDGVPIERAAVDELLGLLELRETIARMREAAPELFDGDADLAPLETMLMPAPVELPCRPAYDDGPLCARDAAVADVMDRFGMIWAALMFISAGLNLIIALFFTAWWPLFIGIFPLASKFTLFAVHIAVVHIITQARLRRRAGRELQPLAAE